MHVGKDEIQCRSIEPGEVLDEVELEDLVVFPDERCKANIKRQIRSSMRSKTETTLFEPVTLTRLSVPQCGTKVRVIVGREGRHLDYSSACSLAYEVDCPCDGATR